MRLSSAVGWASPIFDGVGVGRKEVEPLRDANHMFNGLCKVLKGSLFAVDSEEDLKEV